MKKWTKKQLALFAKQIQLYDRAIAGEKVDWVSEGCKFCVAMRIPLNFTATVSFSLDCENCPLGNHKTACGCVNHKTYIVPDDRENTHPKDLEKRRKVIIKALADADVEVYY